MELKAESRAESGFPQGTLLPNIRSPGPTRLTVQQVIYDIPCGHVAITVLVIATWY
jgi:hypothetical protein